MNNEQPPPVPEQPLPIDQRIDAEQKWSRMKTTSRDSYRKRPRYVHPLAGPVKPKLKEDDPTFPPFINDTVSTEPVQVPLPPPRKPCCPICGTPISEWCACGYGPEHFD